MLDMPSYILGKNKGGGSGGTSNYNDLSNKPSINGVTLSGDLSSDDLELPIKKIEVIQNNELVIPKIDELDSGIYSISSFVDNETERGYIKLINGDDYENPANYVTINGVPSVLVTVYKTENTVTNDNTEIKYVTGNYTINAQNTENYKQGIIVGTYTSAYVNDVYVGSLGSFRNTDDYIEDAVLQLSTLPTVDLPEYLKNRIVQYVGTTNQNYTNGYFYKSVYDNLTDTYYWISVNVQNDVNQNIATEYSASSTYSEGDYVIHNGKLYVCNTTISVAEAWTVAHWTQTTIMSELGNINTVLATLTTPSNGGN